jgi:hypothetical protein
MSKDTHFWEKNFNIDTENITLFKKICLFLQECGISLPLHVLVRALPQAAD